MSTLSQEDRERIYQEEKARMEAQEELKQEAKETSQAKSGNVFGALILCAFVGWGVWSFFTNTNPDHEPTVAAQAAPLIDKSPKVQAERKAMIDKMLKLDVFTKVVRNQGTMPRAWVGKTFATLPYDQKVQAGTLVYAFYFDGTNPSESVALIDGFTGKEIGRFDSSGLTLK